MLKKYFTILICSFTINSFSQNLKIDSLRIELKNDKTDKFKAYKALFNEYAVSQDPDNQKMIAYEYFNYALKSKDNSTIAKSKILIAWYFYHKMDLKKALTTLSEALILANKSNNNYTIGLVYSYIGNIYYLMNDSKNTYKNSSLAINYLQEIGACDDCSIIINNMKLNIINMYINLGQFDVAKSYLFKLKRNFNNLNPTQKTTLLNYEVSIYECLNENNLAVKVLELNLKQTPQIKDKTTRNSAKKEIYFNLANNYLKLNNIFISKQYLDSIQLLGNTLNFVDTAIKPYLNNLNIEILLKEKKYSEAIVLSNESLNELSEMNDLKSTSKTYSLKARGYFEMKDYDNSILNYEKNKSILLGLNIKSDLIESLPKLIDLYSIKNNPKKVKENFELYTKLKNELFNEQVANSITTTEIKYETELKESKIKTQQLQIQKEKSNKNIALLGIAFILFLGVGGFSFYRNKQNQSNLKTQNTLLGLQQNLIEAELSNLNKQLDPHEIKNLIASISPEIQEKAPESYRKMVKLFNLTKASLNSSSITDTIENQLKQVDDFLSLEKSMLPIPLEYSINNTIQNEQILIPRLLLKNLVENALKHGIKQQETGGNISVIVQEKDNFIYITVDDTGKGREQDISLDNGIGTTTYQKLFATLNPKNKENATFEIIDKQQGTKVEVRIPTHYKYS